MAAIVNATRTCVGCKEEFPKQALIRLVRSPLGNVILDEYGKLPGRGAYFCASFECIEKARKTKALSKVLKTEVKADVYDRMTEYIRLLCTIGDNSDNSNNKDNKDNKNYTKIKKELCMLLGMARRAGLVYIGVDSVKLHSTRKHLLILTAADCSDSVSDSVRNIMCGQVEGENHIGKHIYLSAPLDIQVLSSAIGANEVQAIALPGCSGLTDKIKMLILQILHLEGSVALE